MKDSALLKLDYLSILEINGNGSFDLLQGQITADVNKVSQSNCVVGAMCDIKGRVISSFVIAAKSDNNENYCLIGNKGALQILQEALAKYVPFYQTEIKLNNELIILGLNEEELLKDFPDTDLSKSAQIQGKFLRLHYLNKDIHLIITSDMKPFENYEVLEDQDLWDLDDIKNYNFEISSSSSGIFTPHELGYDKTSRIDFKKGCYTGQEVVARMHYRAKNLPKLLAVMSENSHEVMSKVLDKQGKQIGTVLSTADGENIKHYLLSMNKNYKDQNFEF